ncbi:MAG: hypothetical protein ACLQDY_18790 [Streptosporangiaceae bacterium]
MEGIEGEEGDEDYEKAQDYLNGLAREGRRLRPRSRRVLPERLPED